MEVSDQLIASGILTPEEALWIDGRMRPRSCVDERENVTLVILLGTEHQSLSTKPFTFLARIHKHE